MYNPYSASIPMQQYGAGQGQGQGFEEAYETYDPNSEDVDLYVDPTWVDPASVDPNAYDEEYYNEEAVEVEVATVVGDYYNSGR